jgi:hypothetical protein
MSHLMTPLLRISVHVDETDPGHFYWVLMEEGPGGSLGGDRAGVELWLDAFSAGCKALMRRVPDERIGPRSNDESENENEDADPVG